MTTDKPGITWQSVAAPAVTIRDMTIVPHTRVLHVPWPGGGLVWNHPEGVHVTRAGAEQEIPITDVTWIAVMFLRTVAVAALALTVLVSVRGAMPRKRRGSHE
jgi:hypothetical protein